MSKSIFSQVPGVVISAFMVLAANSGEARGLARQPEGILSNCKVTKIYDENLRKNGVGEGSIVRVGRFGGQLRMQVGTNNIFDGVGVNRVTYDSAGAEAYVKVHTGMSFNRRTQVWSFGYMVIDNSASAEISELKVFDVARFSTLDDLERISPDLRAVNEKMLEGAQSLLSKDPNVFFASAFPLKVADLECVKVKK